MHTYIPAVSALSLFSPRLIALKLFSIANSMVTNFHMPKSTMLMMTSAFLGNDFIKKAYEEAIKEKYNFFSYGDSMLII